MIDWNLAGPAAVIGAVAATLGVFFLELFLKPAAARKRVATILLAEIRLNVRGMQRISAYLHDQGDTVPEGVVMSTLGWEAVSADVHFLPPFVLDSLLLRYNQFNEINSLVARYSQKVDLVLQLQPDSPPLYALHSDLQHDARLFVPMLKGALRGCELSAGLLVTVLDSAPPDWPKSSG